MSEVALRTDHLSKHYGHVIALKDLNLEISVGQVVGYLGPNGAGKTTTIRLLLGLARPTSGWARVFGIDCQRRPVDAHRRMACVLSDATLWPRLTGAESLDLLGELHGSVDVAYRAELIERFNLDPSKKVRTYSGGNRQKVLLVAALMTRADLLLLDEPTTGLDPLMEEEFPRLHPRGERAWTDHPALVARPERGRSYLRPGGHPARRDARGNGDSGCHAPFGVRLGGGLL